MVEEMVGYIVFMMIGMGAGMAACPFMMRGIKQWRVNRKVSRILREIEQSKKEEESTTS
jgi:hypothetical protein